MIMSLQKKIQLRISDEDEQVIADARDADSGFNLSEYLRKCVQSIPIYLQAKARGMNEDQNSI
jgi:hypothetical protein